MKKDIGPSVKRTLVKYNRVKSVIYKSIFVMVIIMLILLFTKIDTNPTNRILETIRTNVNYEFQVREDSVRIFNNARNIFNTTIESIPVFNTEEKYTSPVTGSIYRSFDSIVETPNGTENNGGIEIKLDNEMEPRSIMDGRITDIEKTDNKGYFITVEEDNIKVVYGYLQSTLLKEGDLVKKDDIIGEVGANKDGSKYLRLELYIDGELVDPEKHIEF